MFGRSGFVVTSRAKRTGKKLEARRPVRRLVLSLSKALESFSFVLKTEENYGHLASVHERV